MIDNRVQFVDIKETDFEFIKEVYDHYVLHSTATYYTEPVTVDELKSFILVGHPRYKSFLLLAEGKPCGFCYFSRFNKRQAYDRTAEVSLYLKPEYTGKGIGTVVLEHLEKGALDNHIFVLIGIISGENEHSIRLFERNGYLKCGHFKQVGEKFNRILDVVYYQKIISDEPIK